MKKKTLISAVEPPQKLSDTVLESLIEKHHQLKFDNDSEYASEVRGTIESIELIRTLEKCDLGNPIAIGDIFNLHFISEASPGNINNLVDKVVVEVKLAEICSINSYALIPTQHDSVFGHNVIFTLNLGKFPGCTRIEVTRAK